MVVFPFPESAVAALIWTDGIQIHAEVLVETQWRTVSVYSPFNRQSPQCGATGPKPWHAIQAKFPSGFLLVYVTRRGE